VVAYVLEYALRIWDPYLQRDIDSLERIQRKAARFTTRDFRQRSSVTAMMRNLQGAPSRKENQSKSDPDVSHSTTWSTRTIHLAGSSLSTV